LDASTKMADARLIAWKRAKREEQLQRMIASYEKKQAQQERVQSLMRSRIEYRKQLLDRLLVKNMEVEERLRNDKLIMRTASEQFVRTQYYFLI